MWKKTKPKHGDQRTLRNGKKYTTATRNVMHGQLQLLQTSMDALSESRLQTLGQKALEQYKCCLKLIRILTNYYHATNIAWLAWATLETTGFLYPSKRTPAQDGCTAVNKFVISEYGEWFQIGFWLFEKIDTAYSSVNCHLGNKDLSLPIQLAGSLQFGASYISVMPFPPLRITVKSSRSTMLIRLRTTLELRRQRSHEPVLHHLRHLYRFPRCPRHPQYQKLIH